MNKIILTFGFPRTGTTWAFNAVRMIAKKNSVNFKSGFSPSAPVDWINDEDTIILKTHSPWRTNELENIMNAGAAKLIFSVRDAASTVVSQKRIMRSLGIEAKFLKLLEDLSFQYDVCIKNFANFPQYLIIDESEIINKNTSLCNDIQEYCELGNENVSDIAEKLTKDNISFHIDKITEKNSWTKTFTEVDWETQWHANHIWKNPEKINWKPAEIGLIEEINKKIQKIKDINSSKDKKEVSENSQSMILEYLSK